MNKFLMSISLLALVMVPGNVSADHDSSDVYTDVGGVAYFDDDPLPYIYLESNGEPGLQREDDGSGHLGHDNPDLWVF